MEHLTDDDLELHVLGAVEDPARLHAIEEHLLWCQGCIDREANIEEYMKTFKSSLKVHPQPDD